MMTKPRHRPPSRLTRALARLLAYCWRFQTLPLATWLFAEVTSPSVLYRRFLGLRLAVDVARGNPQRLLYLQGQGYSPEQHLLLEQLAPGMTVVDVGANIGHYMLLFARAVGPSGQVVCFEPEPDNLVELARNRELNNLTFVQIEAVALGSEDGTTGLTPGINGHVVEFQGHGLTVPLHRLDSLVSGHVDLLKIDVEGYEGHVLAGATGLLSRCHPALFLELHPAEIAAPHTIDGVLRLLSSLGYSVSLYEPRPEDSFREKFVSRYIGPGYAPVSDPAALLAQCTAGRRIVPFWAVCAPGTPSGSEVGEARPSYSASTDTSS